MSGDRSLLHDIYIYIIYTHTYIYIYIYIYAIYIYIYTYNIIYMGLLHSFTTYYFMVFTRLPDHVVISSISSTSGTASGTATGGRFKAWGWLQSFLEGCRLGPVLCLTQETVAWLRLAFVVCIDHGIWWWALRILYILLGKHSQQHDFKNPDWWVIQWMKIWPVGPARFFTFFHHQRCFWISSILDMIFIWYPGCLVDSHMVSFWTYPLVI